MNKNRFVRTLALIILLTGCSEEKNDFAGFSFDINPAALESQGFICNQEFDKIECTNADEIGSVFGAQTKGVIVTYLQGEKRACCISVGLAPGSVQYDKMKKLRNYISRVYNHMPERDSIGQVSYSQSWMRPDGTSLSLRVFERSSNTAPATARFTSYSEEWEASAAEGK
jgi:hypothetical protein